jgi:phosphoglycerate dehydrogenase-like enzyme
MPVVCLPAPEAIPMLGELPGSVEIVVWDGATAAPPRLAEVEFWAAPPSWGALDDPAETVAAMPALKVIQLSSAGIDNVAQYVPDGVTLCDARGVHGGAVAEWVLTAILTSLRDFPRFVRAQDERHWDQATTDELAGKRVLLIGAGDLGEQTALRLKPFGAKVTLCARRARDGDDGNIVHGQDEIPQLLPVADIVVLLVPRTDETTGLVDAAFLAAMPDGALLVNAARGPVVDTGALLAELTSGRLRAALDVTDPEPLPADHPLWSAPNLLITPHIAGNVVGLPRRANALIGDQIRRYAAGQDLINVVSGDY